MKRAILLLVVVVGGAFYLGWFTFTTDNSGQTEHVNIVIDKNKIRQDEARALDKLHAYEQQVQSQSQSSQTGAASQPLTNQAPQEAAPFATTQPGAYPVQPASSGDPYELPQPPQRPAAQTADSFSRGFQ